MKKIKILSILLLLTLTVSVSCGCLPTDNKTPFDVFSGDFTATLDAEINGTMLGLICQRQGGVTEITLTSPDSVSGYSFSTDADKTVIRYGGIESTAQGRATFLPELIAELFSKTADQITEISSEKTETCTLTLVKTPSVSFRFNEKGLPTHADGIINSSNVKIAFKSFSLTPQVEGSKTE